MTTQNVQQLNSLDLDFHSLLLSAVEGGKLLPSTQANIEEWLTQEQYAAFRSELLESIGRQDWQTLNDNFFAKITFGTGGIRGTTGIGSNRINKATIGRSTQGLANYLKTLSIKNCNKGIVIAYDVRLTSLELAQFTASVVAANGFKTYLFDSFRSTPELSFAVRYLKAAAGIVISASHNPPADNGFKVYWESGEQVVPPFDGEIINQVVEVKEIKTIDFNQAIKKQSIIRIGKIIDQAYHEAVLAESLSTNRSAEIIYSPIHGTGITSLLPVLQKAGFKVKIVTEQQLPDGNFTNVPNNIPNPEVATANQAAADYLKNNHADVAFTNDPDADRLAVLVPRNDSYIQLSGNQTAVLATYYVCSQLVKHNQLPTNGFVSRTIVTTPMIDRIAQAFQLKVYNDLLVGFKYIGALIKEHQDQGQERFIIGAEESLGFLKGSYVRDKDGAVAGLIMAELVSELKAQGKTLLDLLDDLYCQFGYHLEALETSTFVGAQGAAQKQQLMEKLRDHPPTTLGGLKLQSASHRIQATDGSFVVALTLASNDTTVNVFARPSGTEPKIKFYILLASKDWPISQSKLTNLKQQSKVLMDNIILDLKNFI